MMIKIFNPQEPYPHQTIFPILSHGERIAEIVSGQEDLKAVDGLYTTNRKFLLGVKTADCAPVVFLGKNKFGIIHVGWRGLSAQICENMSKIFSSESPEIFCGPYLPKYEIKKDFCFEALAKKFGEKFFIYQGDKIIFDFESALKSLLPTVKFDGRSTGEDKNLASWRRDKTSLRNSTIVGNFD